MPPEMASDPGVAVIAGWEQLTVELSADAGGLRHLMVVLDASGQPISASDHVLVCRAVPGADGRLTEYTHDSLGGRLESDGTFNGTRWRIVRVLAAGEEDTGEDAGTAPAEAQSAKPTDAEVALIKALVAEILRRGPARG